MVYLEPIQYDTDGGGNAVARFTITLASASTQPVTVQYSTSNGTANAGTDYVAAAGAITFAPGVTSQTVEVQVLADTLVEPDESFSVTLSNPTGATITAAGEDHAYRAPAPAGWARAHARARSIGSRAAKYRRHRPAHPGRCP